MGKEFSRIKLIIFDVDGTLRDSSEPMHEGFKRAFLAEGFSFNFSREDIWKLRGFEKYFNRKNSVKTLIVLQRCGVDIKEVLDSKDPEKKLDALMEKHSKPDDDETATKIETVYLDFFNSGTAFGLIKFYPGAQPAIKDLSNKFTLALYTNARLPNVQRGLHEILDNFSVIITENDVKKKKPSGEGISIICQKLGISSNYTAYVGDSLADIAAARDAGCISIAVTCGMGMKKHLQNAKPDLIFRDVAEVASYFCRQDYRKYV